MRNKPNTQEGFLLIALALGLLIIGIILATYFSPREKGQKSVHEVGQEAIQKTKDNNLKELQNAEKIQNELNTTN